MGIDGSITAVLNRFAADRESRVPLRIFGAGPAPSEVMSGWLNHSEDTSASVASCPADSEKLAVRCEADFAARRRRHRRRRCRITITS